MAQNILTVETNAMRNSDRFACQSMGFSNPGNQGKDVSWDFSYIDNLNIKYDIHYKIDSLNRIHQYFGQDRVSFVLNDDTLKQYMFENRLTKVKYLKKKMALRYPLEYGDSISSDFEGYGLYCGNHFIKVKGQVLTQADGEGRLILSDRDTLYNTLRVYTITTTSMAMDIDYAEIDSTKLQQEIEEKYEWYCKGFRYPLYTIVQKTSYTNLEQVGSTQYAYRLLPEIFDNLNDATNDSIQKESAHNVIQNCDPAQDIFHYEIKKGDGRLLIYYTVDADASVRILLSNSQGILFWQKPYTIMGGNSGIITVSTSNLRAGQYALYINVNGKITSKTINIK